MDNQISSENTSFSYLKGSSDFLNIIMNNINSCVLLLDNNMRLQAFNDSMKTIFSNHENEHLLYKKCGNAIGCAYAVEEERECGNTTHCCDCDLRKNAMISYSEKKAIYKQRIDREFYRTDFQKVLKHLQYSTRHFVFEKDNYIILIVEDITQLVDQQIIIDLQQEKLASKN